MKSEKFKPNASYLDHGALHVVVLDDHILLQALDRKVDLVTDEFGEEHFAKAAYKFWRRPGKETTFSLADSK